ncbi:MAG TPA: response regulator, partial [Anaeromyxobacter sp.]
PGPAAPSPTGAAPGPAPKRDPFGFGVAPKAPPRAAEEDFGDLDLGPPRPAARAPAAPPAAIASPPDELSFDVEAEAPAAPKARPASIELPADTGQEPELAPMHAFVPPPEKTGHQPGPAPSSDGGEAALREALSKASRDVIERVVWEVVPQLAETIIRENLDRLVKTR